MWVRTFKLVRGVRGSVPAGWVHPDGRELRYEKSEYRGEPGQWILVTPVTQAEVDALVAESVELGR